MKRSTKSSPLQSIFSLFKNLFFRIFPKTEHPSRQACWDKPDTMVGTVRSWEQLSYNLSHNCYYVPAKFLPQETFPIRYIALHEQDREEVPSICRVGEVESSFLLPRGTIPVSMRSATDPREQYYFFTVKEWRTLPHRIEIVDTPRGKPLFTYGFLLNRCNASWELFAIASSLDYALWEALGELLSKAERHSCSRSISKNRLLMLKNNALLLTDKKGKPLACISVAEYRRAPRTSFFHLKKLLS